MSTTPSEVAQLVLTCRAEGGDAFEPLVRRYQHAAYATAISHVRDAQDAIQQLCSSTAPTTDVPYELSTMMARELKENGSNTCS